MLTLVRHAHVERVRVDFSAENTRTFLRQQLGITKAPNGGMLSATFGVNTNCALSKLFSCPNDTASNFAPVGDQNLNTRNISVPQLIQNRVQTQHAQLHMLTFERAILYLHKRNDSTECSSTPRSSSRVRPLQEAALLQDGENQLKHTIPNRFLTTIISGKIPKRASHFLLS